MYQTQYQAKIVQRPNEIDFDRIKQKIEDDISNNWLGFKYLKQLEERREIIVSKIEKYLSKLKTDNGHLILYCEFTFNQSLDLLIKASDIRKDFIEQPKPNANGGVKINQPDLFSALTQIKDQMYKETATFKDWLYKNQNSKGNIWNQVEWILYNNNDKEGDKYCDQAEKHRKNMINALINTKVDLSLYIELPSYLNHYYQYFDQFNADQRKQIYDQFLSFLINSQDNEELKKKYNSFYRNNSLTIQGRNFVVNIPTIPQFQISIPRFLWTDIQQYDLQGVILYKMLEHQELTLNYQVIENIFLSKQREQQQYRNPAHGKRK